ncbi:YhjD/YihY/BrkB family envelope integrity protein [Geomonas sp.]|uniref:YhjD/YihY/BrkB family envelope integrity protein n=1 Tax=Geomonas sp. TaxID=2651584 RepID=UPI002B492E26|nr:YhjD/YihY/BrkB family envelope integrity protein [Geomonas sp.]HJV33913.1 YhjD/YihY/BrkB family envelope integrity protein [Geomonas sp.]
MDRSTGQKGFFDRLWEKDPAAIGGRKGEWIAFLQSLAFVVSNFFANNNLLRATALSFTTVLSLVPLLALAFSVLKGLGAQNLLAPLIIKQMAAGSEEAVNRIVTYIGNTNMSSVGAIGMVALVYTSVAMLASVEEAFNSIWGVTETRSFYRKFSDFLSVLVSAPLLLLAATSIATTLHSERIMGWLLQNAYVGDAFLFLLSLTQYVVVWIALFLLYLLIPNTRVRYGSALIGAVLAGTLWELAQWFYIHFQVGASRYNAIYGTLAALPILMVWIYTSWLIVLFGMEVVAAHQNRDTFRRDIRGLAVSQAMREMVALGALRHIAAAFHGGEPGWAAEHLAVRLHVPIRVMREILAQLVDAGFIVQAQDGRGIFYPARELNQLSLDEILITLRGHGASCEIAGEEQAKGVLEKVDRAVSDALNGLTLQELAESEKSQEKRAADIDKGGPVDL